MIQRPKLGETEEDLLRQEEEFLKASGKQQSIKRKVEHVEPPPAKGFEILGDIKEKTYGAFDSPNFKLEENKGFPNTFVLDSTLPQRKRGKKSLFVLQLEKNKNKSNEKMEVDEPIKPTQSEIVAPGPTDRDLKETIHKESIEKLSKLSEAEILEEQKKLMNSLDPKLIEFLKSRGKTKSTNKTSDNKQESPSNIDKSSNVDMQESLNKLESETEVKKTLEKYMDSKWVNIDFLEKEKLEWIGDIPDKKSLEPDQPYSARFDFKGELQPFSTEVDVRNSLYHHGDEPNRPGYTIQELYQLSRSKVLQQRNVALTTLANIIRKTKLGYYDKCFDGQMLHKLVESDLFFLLRFSIDENSLVPSSIYCLHNLLCNESDEFCLDKLLGVSNEDEQPLLFNEIEADKDEEKELKDHVVISCDMIKGVLRTDLLLRLEYVLSNFSPSREVIIRAINCVIRISRHSLEAAKSILQSQNLLKIVYKNIKTQTPIYEGVKLFRVIIPHSKEIALEIVKSFDFRFLVCFIEMEENINISKKEFYLLKLESLYLWRNLLIHDLFLDEFVKWSPCLIRLLLFYTQKVDMNSSNDFDFELFSAIASLIIVCNCKKIPSDPNIPVMMRLCLEKWLTQLIQHREYNYAASKALGCGLRYFSSHFKNFGVNALDFEFIKKLNSILVSLFQSEVFNQMSSALRRFSHLLVANKVSRDPKNLPSLCSVYEGGEEFLRLAQNSSPFPFFISLVKYLKRAHKVTHETKLVIKLLSDSTNVQKYLSEIDECEVVSDWFCKYETEFIADYVKLLLLIDNETALKISFSLVPRLRVDNINAKKILKVLCDKRNWKISDSFLDCLGSLYSELFLSGLDDRKKEKAVVYKNNTLAVDWLYKALSLLRGKDAVESVISILKFILLVLERDSGVIKKVPYSFRFYNICHVFLTDSNVFNVDIQKLAEKVLKDVLINQDKVNLNKKFDKNKSFYDLYTELITQYAGVSYGLPLFAKLVMFPLQNRFNVSFRKLIWFEYSHVLRVVTLGYPLDESLELKNFVNPLETDESILVAYINSVSNNVITKNRNGFVYHVAIGNVKNFLNASGQDEKLHNFLKKRVNNLNNEELQNDILNIDLSQSDT